MPSKARRIPKYQLHKGTGHARVRINGQDHWLGQYGTQESHDRYDEVIAKLVTGDIRKPDRLVVSQLLAQFWRHCRKRYERNGKGPLGAAAISAVRIRNCAERATRANWLTQRSIGSRPG